MNENTALTAPPSHHVPAPAPEQIAAMSLEQARAWVGLVQQIMSEVMHEGEHYGKIPGTDKPTLLKSGAEKLGLVFKHNVRYEVQQTNLPNGHREYYVTCHLSNISGDRAWQGVGMASTMESKHRWRRTRNEIKTEIPVPKVYWDMRKVDPSGAARALANAAMDEYPESVDWSLTKAKAVKDEVLGWVIALVMGTDDREENPDIADTYNTVLKMAKKRAHVDAELTACAASDIFTQDVEDFIDAIPVAVQVVQPQPEPEKATSEPPVTQEKPRADLDPKLDIPAKAPAKAPAKPKAKVVSAYQVSQDDKPPTPGQLKLLRGFCDRLGIDFRKDQNHVRVKMPSQVWEAWGMHTPPSGEQQWVEVWTANGEVPISEHAMDQALSCLRVMEHDLREEDSPLDDNTLFTS